MEIHFGLAKRSRSWMVVKIRCLNLGWHVVPANKQHVASYPDWFQNLVRSHLESRLYIGQRTTTMKPTLRSGQVDYFFRDNRLYIGNTLLHLLDSRREEARIRRMNNERISQINNLKFNHDTDDALQFKDRFLACFDGVDEHIAKDYLLEYVKAEHLRHFRSLAERFNLEQLFSEFIATYYRDRPSLLQQLKNTPLSSGVTNFVEKRLLYYKLFYPVLPLKYHIRKFIQDVPDEIRSFFSPNQLPDLLLKTKERLINHITFKMAEQNLDGNRQEQNGMEADDVNNELQNIANELGRPNIST